MKTIPTARPVNSSSKGTIFTSQLNPEYRNPELIEDVRVFNNLYHETEIHTPKATPLLLTNYIDIETQVLPNALDMPIRLKGEREYALPEDWEPLNPVVQELINIEHTNNPNWQDYYTYLSVHYTPELKPGEQQRHAGCHTDGFQGVREPVRTKTSRSYVAVTNGGTKYFPQTFVANLDAGKFNIFEGFDLQVNEKPDGTPDYKIAEENTFYFFDAYTVHESGNAARPGARLFIRLTWEMKLFDRAGNTKNNMLNYDWKPETYDVRSILQTPTIEDIEKARLVK